MKNRIFNLIIIDESGSMFSNKLSQDLTKLSKLFAKLKPTIPTKSISYR